MPAPPPPRRSIHVVTTTINHPAGLLGYAANAAAHGHPKDAVTFVVAGDVKTPASAADCVATISDRFGFRAVYLGVSEQEAYLEAYPELDAHLPWSCIQRRNVAFLWAYEHGADVVITIDDDNFVATGGDGRGDGQTEEDFVGRHCIVGTTQSLEAFEDGTPGGDGDGDGDGDGEIAPTKEGWVNVCRFLKDHRGTTFYHRGYPMGQRWRRDERVRSLGPIAVPVAVNAGLWLEDPDVDAVTRLANDIVAVEYTRDASFALVPGATSWSPFNSQNTAVAREVLEAYFMVCHVGRMDDIWASYVVRRIADHLGHAVAYGFPVVTQARNPHDLFKDLDDERFGMRLTGAVCDALRATTLTGATYGECLGEIATQMRLWVEREDWEGRAKERWGGGDGRCGDGSGSGDGWGGKGGGQQHRAYVEGFVEGMVVWGKTIDRAKARMAAAAAE